MFFIVNQVINWFLFAYFVRINECCFLFGTYGLVGKSNVHNLHFANSDKPVKANNLDDVI
jgi:hypothetical protein